MPPLPLLGFMVLAWRSWIADRQARTAARQADLVERGQVTERFTKAIGQLGDEKRAVRLGGIYSLERIAKDSEEDRGTIVEVLCAFVRDWGTREENGTKTKPEAGKEWPLPVDVEAAVSVLGAGEERGNGLQEFPRNLGGTDFGERNLARKMLSGLNLLGANFRGAALQGANRSRANLSWADLKDANLWGAQLENADLSGADLAGAAFWMAKLHGAKLHGAKLHGAKLGRARVTQEQINSAEGDAKTILPEDFVRPESWEGGDPPGIWIRKSDPESKP